jgi:hypothetical protein
MEFVYGDLFVSYFSFFYKLYLITLNFESTFHELNCLQYTMKKSSYEQSLKHFDFVLLIQKEKIKFLIFEQIDYVYNYIILSVVLILLVYLFFSIKFKFSLSFLHFFILKKKNLYTENEIIYI